MAASVAHSAAAAALGRAGGGTSPLAVLCTWLQQRGAVASAQWQAGSSSSSSIPAAAEAAVGDDGACEQQARASSSSAHSCRTQPTAHHLQLQLHQPCWSFACRSAVQQQGWSVHQQQQPQQQHAHRFLSGLLLPSALSEAGGIRWLQTRAGRRGGADAAAAAGGDPGGGAPGEPLAAPGRRPRGGGGGGGAGARAPPQQPRRNHQITAQQLLVIFPDGAKQTLALADARAAASQLGLDLVEVNGAAQPLPIAKIMDWGAARYEAAKKAEAVDKARRRAAKLASPKEMQFSARIADHDLEVKLRRVSGWLAEGHRVQLVVKHGREEDAAAAEALDYLASRLGAEHRLDVGPQQQQRRALSCLLKPLAQPAGPAGTAGASG